MAKRKKYGKTKLIQMRGEMDEGLLDWILDPDSEITEEVETAIDLVLRDRKKRSQVFLTALAKKHIQRLVYLLHVLPNIEQELFKEKRIKEADTPSLIRLVSAVSMQIDSAADFLRLFVTDPELKTEPPSRVPDVPKEVAAEDITDEEMEIASEIPAEGRRRIHRLLQRMLSASTAVEADDEKKLLEQPEKKSKKLSDENKGAL